MKSLFLTSLILIPQLVLGQVSNADRLKSITELRRFAFASCNHQTDAQPLWKEMISDAPDLFVWGGDNIYANSKNPDDIRASYQVQNQNEDYQFFKAMTPIIGTWDDHDYGYNNGNGSFAAKRKSQEYLLDFLEEPKVSSRRIQDGIHTSYTFGEGAHKIKFILIDNRFFKDVDPFAPFLGQAQWTWLEREIAGSDAAINFIVSGLSVLSAPLPWSEEWADYPVEQARLLYLIQKARLKGVMFLTGDKHFASIFNGMGHLEFLSSGMTHNVRLPLRPYVKKKFPDAYFEFNYGLIDITWENDVPTLSLAVRGVLGANARSKKVRWSGRQWKEI